MNDTKSTFLSVSADLKRVYSHLANSKAKLKNGGYVLNDVPLGDDQFATLISNVSESLAAVERFINDINNNIYAYNQKIAECDAVINS